MKKRIYSTTLSVILVLFIFLSLTIFILNKNIEGYSKGSNSAKGVKTGGISLPNAKLTLDGNLNQREDNKNNKKQ